MRPILLCALTLLSAGCGRSGEESGNAGMSGADTAVAGTAAEAWDDDSRALPTLPPPPPPLPEPGNVSGNTAAGPARASSEQRDWFCMEPRFGVRHCVDMTPIRRPEIRSLPPARARPALGPAATVPPGAGGAAAPPPEAADPPPDHLR